MKKQVLLYEEHFSSETNGLPGGWHVEWNTDLPAVPAIRKDAQCIELLSGGNKYLPIIPDTTDSLVKMTFSINAELENPFGILLCFRYDTFTGHGQYVRIYGKKADNSLTLEYGTTRVNKFTPLKSSKKEIDPELFTKPIDLELDVRGTTATLTCLGKKERFKVQEGCGKIALAREHFWDVLKILALSIAGDLPEKKQKAVSFTVPLPDTPTWYPIYCDITLQDHGNCMDATLSFHGSVAETEVGEGNYHAIRADLLTRPYLKILTEDHSEKHVIYEKTIVLVPPKQVSKLLYKLIYEKVDWPFTRVVRFMKPTGKFDLAVGIESWHHVPSPNLELNPAETVFTTKGKVLYSGLGITPGEQRKIEFLSQPDKAILKKLPATDPRLELAKKFARENHYFMEREVPAFKIRLTSAQPLPVLYEIILEDAFLRPVKAVDFELESKTEKIGLTQINVVELTAEKLKSLSCGVYHLRVRSIDPGVPPLEEYCAFEVMSRKKDALPPPRISGLPFLYNARTETRGLMTDAFDPWKGASVDEGHYISCAVMLPAAARKYKMLPTIKAYGRSNFSWISTRTLDKPELKDNLDIVKDSDYVNVSDCTERSNLTWVHAYYGERLQALIEFLKTLNDPRFDIPALQKIQKKGEILPLETFCLLAENYWEEWLDYMDEHTRKWIENKQKELRKINPDCKLGEYGPFHIYAAALKGPEALRMRGNGKLTPEHVAFWQYEDYPYSCGYGLERGIFNLTSCLLALPGSSIYPEIYTGGKFKQGCPDGAVFYAHPPFGSSVGKGAKQYPVRRFIQQIVSFVYASGHFTSDGFHYWTKQGFQACRFTRPWYERLLEIWPTVLEHPAKEPIRSAAFVASNDSRRAHKKLILDGNDFIMDVRNTASEDVPFIYEASRRAGVCAGFQLWDTDLDKLKAEKTNVLVLPPLKGMKKNVLKRIRTLHSQGVNLIACEDVSGLEDLFGVRNTGKARTITKVTPTGEFCAGMSEHCDDENCFGSYKADGAEVLLKAEIPVLTIKHNTKASAAFFNVPPHMVKSCRLYARFGYGKNNISPLMEKAAGELMRRFSQTDVTISAGSLIACHTQDNAVLVAVSNPDLDHELITEIKVANKKEFSHDPEVNRLITLLREEDGHRVYRACLPPSEVLIMLFK